MRAPSAVGPWLACAALLVGARAAAAEPVRVVRVKVVADEESRRFAGWRSRIEAALTTASERLGGQVGLKFEVVDAAGWHSGGGLGMRDLLGALRQQVERAPAEIVVGLTLQFAGDPVSSGGLAAYMDGYTLVRDRGRRDSFARAVGHELAHLFGAVHLARGDGLMAAAFPSWHLDPANAALMVAHRERRFGDHATPLAREQLPAAIAAAEQGLEQGLAGPDIRIRLAWLLTENGAHDQALRWAQEAVDQAPDRPEALNVLGMVRRRLGDYPRAIETYSRALLLRPDDPVTYFNLGLALARQGDPAAAERADREALRLRPNYAEPLSNLAKLELDAGRADAAIALAERALEIHPGYAEAHANRCTALARSARFGEALAACDRALELGSTSPGTLEARATALLGLGRTEESVALFRTLLQRQPSSSSARANLMLALRHAAQQRLGQGDSAGAIDAYQQLLGLAPGDGEAHHNLAVLFFRGGSLERARDHLRQALAAGITPNPELARALQ
jgi:Flp pilus assembly protein TadD